jgi:hypothetical protein
MFRRLRLRKMSWLLAVALAMLAAPLFAQNNWPAPPMPSNPYAGLTPSSQPPANATPYPATGAPIVTEWQADAMSPTAMNGDPNCGQTSANWIVPGNAPPAGYPGNQGYPGAGYPGATGYVDANVYYDRDPALQQQMVFASDAPWHWQVAPEGLIYRSYWAGPREPRLGVTLFRKNGGDSFWDPTLGGRVGILRFGNDDPIHPQGWQWDFEGAALARLELNDVRDLESVDFRGGTFITYGVGRWQFKLGYDHLSSHLGDEYLIEHPSALADRLNYVRDSIIAGASFYPIPELRLYGEAGYGVNVDGGAEPWEVQFGTELSKAGPTGNAGSPFLALNANLREEVNFSGDFTAQAGWLWRNDEGQVLRIGVHYLNGKSSQYQWFDKWEEQIGAGVWYDF